jgi:hypothetical protein
MITVGESSQAPEAYLADSPARFIAQHTELLLDAGLLRSAALQPWLRFTVPVLVDGAGGF